MRYRLLAACFCLLFPCSLTAHANSGQAVYDVSGTLVIAGASSCSPGCGETINFSMDLTYALGFDGTYDLTVVGGTSIGTGAIDYTSTLPALMVSEPQPFTNENANYLNIGDPFGDQIDLYFADNAFPSNPSAPVLAGGYLYSCTTDACNIDLCPGAGYPCVAGSESLGIFKDGTLSDVTVSVVAPEPGSAASLFLGVGVLMLLESVVRRRRQEAASFDRAEASETDS